MPEPTQAPKPAPNTIDFIRGFMAQLPADMPYTATVIEALGGDGSRIGIRQRLDDFVTSLRKEAYSPDTKRLTIIVLYEGGE